MASLIRQFRVGDCSGKLALFKLGLSADSLHRMFSACWAEPQSPWFSRCLVAHATGIPKVLFMSAGTFGQPFLCSGLHRIPCFCGKQAFEEAMFCRFSVHLTHLYAERQRLPCTACRCMRGRVSVSFVSRHRWSCHTWDRQRWICTSKVPLERKSQLSVATRIRKRHTSADNTTPCH